MKRLEFTCEGCDLTRYVTLPPGGKTDVTLDGWVAHHVVMLRIPTQAGRGYRFEAGHHSEMKPAT